MAASTATPRSTRAHRWDVPARLQHRATPAAAAGPPTARASRCTGKTSPARRAALHVLGPAAAGEPPVERARRARRRARRQGRADPAAAPGDRRRAHRGLPAGRGRGAAVVPVRPRGARVPAAEFARRRSRSSIRSRCRTSRRSATAARASRTSIGVAGARESWRHAVGDAARSRRRRTSRRSRRAPTDPALLVYTSGTTGPPKGALMPQQCLLGNLPGLRPLARRLSRSRATCSGRRPTGRGPAA